METQVPATRTILQQPNTRIRLNPETYIKFDGTDKIVIRNAFDEKTLQFKYDIMLILYDMVEWKMISELLAPWPPEDQVKIVDYLVMMYDSKVIITDDSEIQELPESGLADNLGKNVNINVENHHNMLKDHVRMVAYRRAIERTVTPETIALDLGCGTGVLGFFAAKAGAQKVYGIEKQAHVALIATELAKTNGLEDKVTILEGTSTQIPAERLEPRPNLLISEIIGNAILEEHIIEFTVDARDRLLAPDAKMIPWKLDILLFGFRSDYKPDIRLENEHFKDLYGLDFQLLSDVLHYKTVMRLDRYQPMSQKTMTDPILAKSLDFYTLQNAYFSEDFEVEALEDGEINHFCLYFRVHLDDDTILTNSPWTPQTHWTHIFYKLPAGIQVQAGEKVQARLVYDGSLRLLTPDQY